VDNDAGKMSRTIRALKPLFGMCGQEIEHSEILPCYVSSIPSEYWGRKRRVIFGKFKGTSSYQAYIDHSESYEEVREMAKGPMQTYNENLLYG